MARLLAILTLLFWTSAYASQDTLLLSDLNGDTAVSHFADYAVHEQTHDFLDLDFGAGASASVTRDSSLFVRFYVLNDLPKKQRLFVKLNYTEFWEFLDRDSSGNPMLSYAGYMEDFSKLDVDREKRFFDFYLQPGQYQEVLLKSYNISTRRNSARGVFLLSEKGYLHFKEREAQRELPGLSISIFFQGAIFIMALYMLLLYFQNNRDKTYLYYGLYMFCGMYYMLQKIAGDGPFFFLFPDNAIIRHLLNDPIQWLIYIFYNLFVLHFLEIKRRSRFVYKLLRSLNVIYFVYMCAQLIFMTITFDKVTGSTLFLVSRIAIITMSVFIIVSTIRLVRSPLVIYIVLGSSFFLVLTMFSMFYSLGLSWLPETSLYPINFMQIGILLEILCFSLGLGKRIRLADREKAKLHQAYINQLVRNEEIIQLTNKKLVGEVDERTMEVLDKTRELELEREEKLRAKYEKQLTESEMSALRLQMNPHFIFNSLNSIRYYILKEDSEMAADYITSFSKLLRMILQHSKRTSVKLSEELQALKLYLEFERQRFENKFEFSVELGPEVNPEELHIQPMIIQPFIENSIWHGLMHKEGTGHLKVDIKRLGDKSLQITIDDDGVGREASRKYKEGQQNLTYKSMGMQITRDRLKLMSKLEQDDTGYDIIDLENESGEAIGTRVIIKVRLK